MYLAARGKSVDLRKGSQHVVYRSVDLTRRMHNGVDDRLVSGRKKLHVDTRTWRDGCGEDKKA